MDELLTKIKADKLRKVKINDKEFTLKKIDAFVLKELQIKAKRGEIDFETEALLQSVVNFSGIKTKDLTDNKEAYSDEDWEKELPFHRDYLQLYLGENPEALAKLYGDVVQNLVNFNAEILKKKATSVTESKE